MKALLYCALLCFVKIHATNAKPHVVVVGSGPSGIAAATKLLKHNFSVQVFEAENRIGGRIYTIPFGDSLIDLGAQWIHGQKDNVVYEMVKDLNIVDETDNDPTFWASDRKYIPRDFQDKLYGLFEELYESADNRSEGVSLGAHFMENYMPRVTKEHKDDKEKLEVALAMLHSFHGMALGSEGAFSWFDVSAKTDYHDCAGIQAVNWQGRGYKTILDLLMKPYPTFEPTLKSKVEKIEFSEHGCTVLVGNQSYSADHVIFTPSLGVLKDNYERLFHPALSDEKVTAVMALGIGAVMKVFLMFPERWWPKEDFDKSVFVWKDSDRLKLMEEFPRGPSLNQQSWLLDVLAIRTLPTNEKVLMLWLSGKLIPEIEKLEEQVLIDGAMFVLRKFFDPKYNITEPIKILRTNWYNNPNFRGSYSFQTMESKAIASRSSNVILSEPIVDSNGVPRVLFAGEATSHHHFSTVHGAIETGWREAERLADHYKNK